MVSSAVTTVEVETSGSFRFRTFLAFFAIYFVWGTTFLAIRIAVEQLPPLFAAGSRFLIAGTILLGLMLATRHARPSARQWRNLLVLSLLMFVAEYGPLFWAEKYVPSGIVSVLAATIPIITLVIEMVILRQQKWHLSLAAATALGFVGVGILLLAGGRQHFPVMPCLAILCGCTTWSLGTVLSRRMDLPKSRPVTAGATMMLGGGILLLISAAMGDMQPLPQVTLRAGLAVLYLILFGSILAFTAFVWLLAHMAATRVASHAYVNPLVAVALGHFAAGEPVTLRTMAGTALVLISVFIILRRNG